MNIRSFWTPFAAARTGGAILALSLVLSSIVFADVSPVPRSFSEAIQMEREDGLPRTAFYESPPLGGSKPGDLLRKEDFVGYVVPQGVRTVRVLYHSLSALGNDVATSAVVLIPPGKAPSGGWPVIAWAHGTSGVARMCAPSLMKDLVYGEEGLMPMVRAGFAVVATDYHGLGTEGPHEYLNKVAQSRDVIYSIPAARAAVPELGRRWVVVGHSQGGLAAWSVGEIETTLHDPDYLGSVSVAGTFDIKSLLSRNGEPGSFGAFYLTYLAFGLHAQSPSFLPGDVLEGKALERYTDSTTKGCWDYAYAGFIGAAPGPVLKTGWEQNPAVTQLSQIDEIGAAPIKGPFLVIAGEADESVTFRMLRPLVQKACRNGVALEFRSYPGLDHDPVMDRSTPDQLVWIRDRFAGKPSANSCKSLLTHE